jgi:hypothetical protein
MSQRRQCDFKANGPHKDRKRACNVVTLRDCQGNADRVAKPPADTWSIP